MAEGQSSTRDHRDCCDSSWRSFFIFYIGSWSVLVIYCSARADETDELVEFIIYFVFMVGSKLVVLIVLS